MTREMCTSSRRSRNFFVFFESANYSCPFQVVHNFREGCLFQRLRYSAFFKNERATEELVTDQYACGWTMRFPRCKEIRHDMGIDDCLKYTGALCLTCGFSLLANIFCRPSRINIGNIGKAPSR